MKKLLLLLSAVGLIFTACEAGGGLNEGGNGDLPLNKIATIEEQGANIKATIATLETTKSAVNATIASLNEQQPSVRGNDNGNNGVKDMIAALEERLAALEQMIASLKEYADGDLSEMQDWAEATFATMEQYNALASELATLKALLEGFEGVSTTELSNALAVSEQSMKQWVNEQLSGYATIAEVDAQIAALKESLTAELSEQVEKVVATLTALMNDTKQEYEKAITDAIQNQGVINEQIAADIAAVNKRIDEELATINKRLDDIEKRLDEIEEQLKNLVKRIQSAIYWGADNPAVVVSAEGKLLNLIYAIKPIETVADIAQAWRSVLSVYAICSAESNKVDVVDMPIVSFEADLDNGTIQLTVSGDNLNESFYGGGLSARAVLRIDDGNNDLETTPVVIVPKMDQSFASEITSIPADNEIYILTNNGKNISLNNTSGFGAKLSSSYFDFERGWYVLKFDGAIETIPDGAFLCEDPDSPIAAQLSDIALPESISSIGENAFYQCKALKKINIPEKVASIGKDAFSGCKLERADITNLSAWCRIELANTNASPRTKLYLNGEKLTKLVVPSDITNLNYGVFYACKSITEAVLHDGVTTIGISVFGSCQTLEKITFGNGIESISKNAFSYCRALKSIVIPDSVRELGNNAFKECTGCESFVIGSGVTTIGTNVFENCAGELIVNSKIVETDYDNGTTNSAHWLYGSNFSKVIIGSNVTKLGGRAFQYYSSLIDVTIPDSVTELGNLAFMNCTSLADITIPNSVTSMGTQAVYGCTKLKTILFPNKLTAIKGSMCKNCTALETVVIPESVTSIGAQAFAECTSLMSVYCKPVKVPTLANVNAFQNNAAELKIYVPMSSVTQYKKDSNWKSLTSAIDIDPSSMKKSDYYIEYTSTNGAIVMPNGSFDATIVGNFYENGIGKLYFDAPVISIVDYAFDGYISLASVTIPDSVTKIGGKAFTGCTSLTSVTIGNSVTSIGANAFESCTSLKSVTIPDSVTSIGNYAFYECTSLTSVTIGNSVTSIGTNAFAGCTSLTSVTIPDSVTSIGNFAFYNCTSLTSVYCKPTTPPTGGSYMFNYNVSGRKIYVPRNSVDVYKSAEYWGDYADYIEGYDF